MVAPRHALVLAVALAAAPGCDKDKKDGNDRREGQDKLEPAPVAAAETGNWIEIAPNKPIGPPMAAHTQAAIKAGKKAYAYLHADWCEPCVAIENTRHTDPAMKAAFANVLILALDIDRVPAQQLNDQSLSYGAIPVFYRLDDTGAPSGDSIDGGAWGENTPANMAPVLTAFFAK